MNTAFFLKNVKNTILDFGGAVLTFHGRIQPFLLESCENITIKNVIIAYERPMFTEFDVLDNINGNLLVKPKDGFQCKVENGYLIPYCIEWENRTLHDHFMFLQAFDSETREGKGICIVKIGEEITADNNYPSAFKHVKVSEENGSLLMKADFPKEWGKGTTCVLEHDFRDMANVFLCGCKDISIVNYRIINGGGWGILGMYNGNITIDGYQLIHDELSKSIITNTADAVHLISTKGKINIKNSIIEGVVDDELNIHTNFYNVERAEGKLLHISKNQKDTLFDIYFQRFGIGDVIAVYKGESLGKKAEYTIRSITVVDSFHMFMEVDRDAAGIHSGDAIENLSTQPEVTIENCTFGKANSHLRLQTRGKTIMSGCNIELPLLLTCDMDYPYEASPITDLTVENCNFTGKRAEIRIMSDCHPNEKIPYCHSNIMIWRCCFETEYPVSAWNAKGLQFIGNEGCHMKLKLHECYDVKTDCAEIVET